MVLTLQMMAASLSVSKLSIPCCLQRKMDDGKLGACCRKQVPIFSRGIQSLVSLTCQTSPSQDRVKRTYKIDRKLKRKRG